MGAVGTVSFGPGSSATGWVGAGGVAAGSLRATMSAARRPSIGGFRIKPVTAARFAFA
jgi:hypothetical protein